MSRYAWLFLSDAAVPEDYIYGGEPEVENIEDQLELFPS